MERKKREKFLKIFVPIILTIIIANIVFIGYKLLFNKKKHFLETIDTSVYAKITYEAIYGIHLNFKGTFEIPENVTDIKLILTDGKTDISLPYEEEISDNVLNFSTSKLNNTGINLEKLPLGTYYLMLKGIYHDNQKSYVKYYSVENKTYSDKYQKSFNDMEYYTLTKDGKNNKISFNWNTYENCPTLKVNIEEQKLPDDVYDITIDPGHGGSDVGAIGKLNNKEYTEADLNLKVSLKLKEYLEEQGYKVAMTRNDDSYVEIYSKNGSATLANETKSKFNFAIHHNSFEYEVDYLKGLEVYVADNIDSNILINHITSEAFATISPKETYCTEKGIYQRYFSQEEIDDDEIQPSNKTTQMIYYYNIRELGGIITNSTNDGRYEDYPKNPYYDANVTTEPYLLELGYINNEEDLKSLINNSDNYAKAIKNALVEYLNQ